MTLRFIVGAAGAGKTHMCLDAICQSIASDPLDGVPLLFVVPEQATFQMERALLHHHPDVTATARARVVSFSRLSHLILDECGRQTLRPTSGLASLLALHHVILHHKHELKLFGGSAVSDGFLEQLDQTIHEFKAYEVTPEILESLAEQTDQHTVLGRKLHDLTILFSAFNTFISDRAHEVKTPIELATGAIQRTEFLKDARIWIDGFAGFTPHEYTFLAALLPIVSEANVALCVEPAALGGTNPMFWESGPVDALFHPTRETLVRLTKLAKEVGLFLAPPVMLDGPNVLRERKETVDSSAEQVLPRFKKARLLGDIERFIGQSTVGNSRPVQGGTDGQTGDESASKQRIDTVSIVEAPNVDGEIETAAEEIAFLVREKGFRYSEIAVIVRDLTPFREKIETIFLNWGFPFFMDVKDVADHHPLVVLIRSALEIALGGWSNESVFRFLKTDLLPVERDVVDRLENDAIIKGVTPRDWITGDVWPDCAAHGDEDVNVEMTQLYDTGRRLIAPLKRFDRIVRSGAGMEQARFYIDACRTLLEESGVLDTVESWADESEHRQVIESVFGLFEQMDHMLGEDVHRFEQFAEILLVGMKQIRIRNVPPRVDQLLVGAIERSRQPDLKAVILLGCNDGVFPRNHEEDALFLDDERERLSGMGISLGPTSRTRQYYESYFVYIALTRAKKRLIMTYSRSDQSGRPMRASGFISRLIKQFPEINVRSVAARQTTIELPKRPGALPVWLAKNLRAAYDRDVVFAEHLPMFEAARAWLEDARINGSDDDVGGAIDPLHALTYVNISSRLPKSVVSELIGEPLRLSPSGIESAAACLFRYFSGYSLNLTDREPPQLDALTLGNIRHAALRRFVEKSWRDRADWTDLTEGEVYKRMGDSLRETLPDVVKKLAKRSGTVGFTLARLERGLMAFARALMEHAKRGSFRPILVEQSFGPGGAIPPIVLHLPDGSEALVRGRIDRIDTVENMGETYFVVIDYKSSKQRFRLDELAYGIDLQLGLYMLALTNGPVTEGASAQGILAGALYAPVLDPIIKLDEPPDGDGHLWLKELRFAGVILDDGFVPRLMDGEATGSSSILPLYFKKDGTLGTNSSVATKTQMNQLVEATRKVAMKTASRIAEGHTDISPYMFSGRTPCTYCNFKPVCQFEPGSPGNTYRFLRSDLNNWSVIDALLQEDGAGDNETGKGGENHGA